MRPKRVTPQKTLSNNYNNISPNRKKTPIK
jgi:hypothetical protein